MQNQLEAGSLVGTKAGFSHDMSFFSYARALKLTSYGVYISQLIRFARVCSNVYDFNNRNLFLTSK